jgi:hypothetical protein
MKGLSLDSAITFSCGGWLASRYLGHLIKDASFSIDRPVHPQTAPPFFLHHQLTSIQSLAPMKRDRDDTESPPPKKSRKSDAKRADDADNATTADKADGPPQRKTDDKNDPYWEVCSPNALVESKFVSC